MASAQGMRLSRLVHRHFSRLPLCRVSPHAPAGRRQTHWIVEPMHKPIRKAVLPVAGLGTRFLPATKAVPKEMLTVVDRPVVQHVVDEARAAGIEHIVFVTGRNKGMIEDHFDMAYELEDTLFRRGNKQKELDQLKADLPAAGATSFTRQQAPLGLGHAVWCARDIVGDEPFALLLPDMLHHTGASGASKGCLAEMIAAYNTHGGNHIAVAPVPDDQTHQYGIVGVKDRAAKVSQITQMVEKPPKGTAPSNLHITGRYILQPSIFALLAAQEKGAGGEIQLTDSMLKLADVEPFFAVRFDGTIYDTGTKLGFLSANVAYGLDRSDLADGLKAEISRIMG
jgi:UTP--glucose-1-phosphate uridylyltransferase